MSLLLNGAKTITIAGTEMQCIEIYTGESYTLPLSFTYANTAPINCTGWTLSTAVKYYTVDTVTYPTNITYQVILGNLTPLNNIYTGTGLTATFTTAASGLGYLYIPTDIANGSNGSPSISFTNTSANSTIAVITLGVARTDTLSSKSDYNREPLGIIVRYQ